MTVMAPGDREWTEAEARARDGVTIDPATALAFRDLADEYSVAFPAS
jgi:LDH2 family malate/lactate/ureidoglycolate dehydrogenase